MKSNTQMKKWGNSLAVRIPQDMAKSLNLAIDSNVQISSNGKMVILKPQAAKKLALHDLVNDINDENKHQPTNWGKPVGKEIW